MRPDPQLSPPAVTTKRNESRRTRTIDIRLITPMFGGGVEPQTHDRLTPIRGASVRGQLRFWWRACRAAAFETVKDLRARETEIWGGPSKTGKVVLSVAMGKLQPEPISPYPAGKGKKPGDWKVPQYAGFPLRPDDEESERATPTRKPPTVLANVNGRIEITYAIGVEQEVEAALWAWATFGGLGGRTRRGFGAVQAEKWESGEALRRAIEDGLSKHVVQGPGVDGVPSLRGARYELSPKFPDATKAWESAIGALARFRQARSREAKGRSAWPEADAIRALAKELPADRKKRFPRAAFGLPIIFHFKNENDPPDMVLRGAKSERLASPLILKPLQVGDGAVVVALLLVGPRAPKDGLVLVRKEDKKQIAEVSGQGIEIPGVTGEDVLGSFLDKVSSKPPTATRPAPPSPPLSQRSHQGNRSPRAQNPRGRQRGDPPARSGPSGTFEVTLNRKSGKAYLEGDFGDVPVPLTDKYFPKDLWTSGLKMEAVPEGTKVIVELENGKAVSVKPRTKS